MNLLLLLYTRRQLQLPRFLLGSHRNFSFSRSRSQPRIQQGSELDRAQDSNLDSMPRLNAVSRVSYISTIYISTLYGTEYGVRGTSYNISSVLFYLFIFWSCPLGSSLSDWFLHLYLHLVCLCLRLHASLIFVLIWIIDQNKQKTTRKQSSVYDPTSLHQRTTGLCLGLDERQSWYCFMRIPRGILGLCLLCGLRH